jgi:D-lactate dehydrogenase (cytochrome)
VSNADAIAALSDLLGPRLSVAAAAREHHGHDEAHHAPAAPDAVAWPESTAEVAEIVRICAAARCPITPFGVGTSLEGQVIPARGGLSLDMSRMDKILAVNAEDLDAVAQPGVTRTALNAHLRDTGLFFPVDPGADATLGGMAATRASGTNAVRYGTMRENVLALEAVLADGRVIRTGTRARKSSAGYDLTRLLVGSEGTLGIITELTVRLYGQPEAASAAICAFPDIAGAVNTTILTMQMGLPVARIELLDEVQIGAVNAYSQMDLPERPTLFLEFHGTEASVAETAERVGEIAAEHGGSDFQWATRAEDRNRLWSARHSAYWAGKALRPGCRGWVTDACVPISRLTEAIVETKADLADSPLIAPLVGHVGDGNFHLCILLDPDNPEEHAEAERLSARIAERALRLGGTVTGEHGVGLGKKAYMAAEHGEAWTVMGAIKRALDPEGILNPGKLVPTN